MPASVSAANDQRADIVDDAVGALAQPFETDRHREPDIDVQRDLVEPAPSRIDVAAGHVVAHLEDREQHAEQQCAAAIIRAGASSARRRSSWPPSQNEAAGMP